MMLLPENKFTAKKVFVTNDEKLSKSMVMCSSVVNKNAVSRTVIDGIEHIIISSKTLPDDVVMNGGLYPADEIAKSYKSLERTLAPIEHPKDSKGNYLSAADPIAIHNYYAGAFNQNVRRENGRVLIDKVINVPEAMKSERGKRLLERVKELETNSNPRPIHTSTGLLCEKEDLSTLCVNAAGQQYSWIARNMVFDHDAILLDSVAAAQPHQGVGMAVNGEKFVVNSVDLDATSEDKKELCAKVRINEEYFTVNYTVVDGKTKIIGNPVPVESDPVYTPVTNEEGSIMKSLIINALSKAGIKTDGLSDEQLMAAYNGLIANQDSSDNGKTSDNGADLAVVVANALKPVADELASVKAQLAANAQIETDKMAELVGNSDKYPGITVDMAKKMSADVLKVMAANCQTSYGIPLTTITNDSSDNKPFEMPA